MMQVIFDGKICNVIDDTQASVIKIEYNGAQIWRCRSAVKQIKEPGSDAT